MDRLGEMISFLVELSSMHLLFIHDSKSSGLFSFSALTLLVGNRKGIWPVKQMGVGLLVVTI